MSIWGSESACDGRGGGNRLAALGKGQDVGDL
jgi:hypothetical protein